jgi:hypothetical protein
MIELEAKIKRISETVDECVTDLEKFRYRLCQYALQYFISFANIYTVLPDFIDK